MQPASYWSFNGKKNDEFVFIMYTSEFNLVET